MPLQQTTGNVTTDAYGGGVAAVPNYIEDVFSTYLYSGNSSTQTITNGIDLSTKGGLVWIKKRNSSTYGGHLLVDTANGTSTSLSSNITNSSDSLTGFTSFNTSGFSMSGACYTYLYNANENSYNYVSWTFRKQPKFFDVVTYTGTGSATTIAHSLGSVPGCVIVKRTDDIDDWAVYHNGLNGGTNPENYRLFLNSNTAQSAQSTFWNNTAPTSTTFTVGTSASTNGSGSTYVAYLFAHNAGGFGLTGTDNVISCGSFTTDAGGNATVNLGYEPQFVIYRRSSGTDNWAMLDQLRGFLASNSGTVLNANLANAETVSASTYVTSTGFKYVGYASATIIYIAIRRGPMKVPTSGTSVFSPATRTGTGAAASFTGAGFPVDFVGSGNRNTANGSAFFTRLQGSGKFLYPFGTNAEITDNTSLTGFDSMTGFSVGSDGTNAAINYPSNTYAYWNFRRAPSFFDEVCYTGTGSARTITHNLGAVPELMIIKNRGGAAQWVVYSSSTGNTDYLSLNLTDAKSSFSAAWNNTTPTSSVFTIGTWNAVNLTGYNFVAYLFATCAGVSKVGSYTGNGSSQTINCGFTGGARFVLIKRTDSTGDWYVYDTARGMTTLTDPYLLLNSTAAESATLGSVTSVSTGFAVNASILAAINTNAASYIFLAIA